MLLEGGSAGLCSWVVDNRHISPKKQVVDKYSWKLNSIAYEANFL